MSDLISRSEVNDVIDKLEVYTCGRLNTMKVEVSVLQLQRFINKLKNIPTAYSVDKVIKELEKIKGLACDGKSCSECEYTSDCLEGEQSEKVAIDKAIKIVNHGCVGTEIETIRDKAVKWNNNSSKRVPYEFIDYVEGKREIGVSDNVCEWKYNDAEYYWESSCDHLHIFMSDGPKENEYRFCPYCGKKIKIVGD